MRGGLALSRNSSFKQRGAHYQAITFNTPWSYKPRQSSIHTHTTHKRLRIASLAFLRPPPLFECGWRRRVRKQQDHLLEKRRLQRRCRPRCRARALVRPPIPPRRSAPSCCPAAPAGQWVRATARAATRPSRPRSWPSCRSWCVFVCFVCGRRRRRAISPKTKQVRLLFSPTPHTHPSPNTCRRASSRRRRSRSSCCSSTRSRRVSVWFVCRARSLAAAAAAAQPTLNTPDKKNTTTP